MNCKDAKVDSQPIINSSGTYILNPEAVQKADEAAKLIVLVRSEICDSVLCKTSHTLVEELHDQAPWLYQETIIQVNPYNVNLTPHKDTNKNSPEKKHFIIFRTPTCYSKSPNEQKTIKKGKHRLYYQKPFRERKNRESKTAERRWAENDRKA